MQIKNEAHYKNQWIVQDVLADFEVENVWQFPVTLQKEHTIPLFQAQLFAAMEQLSQKGLAGLLFKFRFFLGRLFGWDTPDATSNNSLKKEAFEKDIFNNIN
ncbi:MAG: hypothetical protein AB8G86_22320 [Saprospiraceae bacterium]